MGILKISRRPTCFFSKVILLSLLLIVLSACKSPSSNNAFNEAILPYSNEYATRFSYTVHDKYTLLEVFRPWQQASASEFKYILAHDEKYIPDSLNTYSFVKTPLQKVVLMSTTFIPMLDTLGVAESICGISGASFVYNRKLQSRIDKGEVRDVGFDQQLNYELILKLNPDAVFLYGVQAGIVQIKEKLEELGIPVVLCADYLESDPLGRSEWIKFFSLFYDKEKLAQSIFSNIANDYNELKVSSVRDRSLPKVMMGLPWKDSWYIAGGDSYAAHLIEDAGASYVWSDLDTDEARAFDIESVFFRTLDCDIWINAGVAGNLDEIYSHDQRFKKIKPVTDNRVFNNNKRISTGGGNDYWESGVLFPNLILRDLKVIFTADEEKYNDMYYYRRLQ